VERPAVGPDGTSPPASVPSPSTPPGVLPEVINDLVNKRRIVKKELEVCNASFVRIIY